MTVVPTYSFLSKPPPQKKRPVIPLPPTPRTCAIASWAAHVQPGSPGSPNSPRRRSSLSRRRPSVNGSPRSFLIIETPSPDAKDFSIDLTGLGYTSVFLHLPKTPSTPAHPNPNLNSSTPSPAKPIKRFRSLSILRPRRNNRSTTATLPPSPTKSKSKSKPKSKTPSSKFETPQILAASIARRKKATYAYAAPPKSNAHNNKKTDLPPSLAAEIALMQFADGGSTEANIKRLMEAHARANAPAGTQSGDKLGMGVGDVYRDGKGGIWWDREEEMEYMHLLGGRPATASQVESGGNWVSFGGEVKEGKTDDEENDGALELASLAGVVTRRGSAATSSTVSFTSSLDPCNVVHLAEDDAMLVRVPISPVIVLPPLPLPSAPTSASTSPGMTLFSHNLMQDQQQPILGIPSRPRSTHHHVHTSPRFFVFDSSAVPQTPRSIALRSPKTPLSPSSPHPYAHARSATHPRTGTRSSPTRVTFPHPSTQKRRRAATAATTGAGGGQVARRRRPAPLTIVAHAPMRGVSPELGEDGDGDEEMGVAATVDVAKREFMEDSFAPAPARAVAVHEGGHAIGMVADKQKMLKKKASKSILGLFGRK